MATKVYDSGTVYLMDGTELYITPLKIKYLREFMNAFEDVKSAQSDDEAIGFLASCAAIAMKQFCPELSSQEKLEDAVDLQTIYKILDLSAGIKIDSKSESDVKSQATDSGSTWENLDLAKLEAEVFLIGKWKDYEDLETSLSMQELTATLESKRELDYQDKKFMAAIQGVDLDADTNKSNAWEDMKARVFSGGKTSDPNDIMSFQGVNAQKAGFGIGMGLDYEDLTTK